MIATTKQTTSETSTGEFHPNIGHEKAGGNPLQVGNQLLYICPDPNSNLKLGVGDISALVQSGDLQPVTQKSNWSSFKVRDKVGNHNDANFKTKFVPDMVQLGSQLYIFWADTHDSGTIYAVSQDLTNGTWSGAAYQIQVDGSDIVAPCNLSAFVIDGRIRLSWFDADALTLKSAMLRPSEISTSAHTWATDSVDTVQLNDIDQVTVDSSYFNLSSDWYSLGNGGNAHVVALYSTKRSKIQSLIVPLKTSGDIDPDISVVGMPALDSRKGCGVRRDPAGRMVLVHGIHDSGKDLVNYRTLATMQDYFDRSGTQAASPAWSAPTYIGNSTKKSPSIGFVFGPKSASSVQLQGRDGEWSSLPSTRISSYRFIFYARKNESNGAYDVQCHADLYGTSQIVPEYNEMQTQAITEVEQVIASGGTPTKAQLDAAAKGSFVPTQVLEPFPFPNQNIDSHTTDGQTLIAYTYGTSSTTILTSTVTTNLTFGIRSSLTTSKGIGPAVESEFKTGPSSSETESLTRETAQGLTMDTVTTEENGGIVVSPYARLEGRAIPNVSETASIFYDVSGTRISGVDAPVFSSMIWVDRSDGPGLMSDRYQTFYAKQGDMTTYTEQKVNAQMAALYDSLDEGAKEHLDPGYAENYVQKIIVPRAVEVAPGKRYLEFRVDPDATNSHSFKEIKSKAVSAGWTWQESDYVGIGFGEEVSLFGFGEETSGSILGGFDFEAVTTSGSEDQEEWGVTTAFSYPAVEHGSVSYTVRMYICQSDNLWVRELQYFADDTLIRPQEVDFVDSRPMKVFFLVTSIDVNP